VSGPDLRLLLVHAHPDDEVIQSGIVMARYADEGVGVTLITCTLGEEGEVLVPDLVHLAAAADDTLGTHRIGELAEAMAIIGVTDHRYLGGPGRYRDSGMILDENGRVAPRADIRPDSFWQTDLLTAATDLVGVIREVRPQVLVTENEYGSYGHPDHIKSHRVATYATALAAAPSFRRDLGDPWQVAKVYWSAWPESEFRAMVRADREAGNTESWGGIDPDGQMPPAVTPDERVTTTIHEPKVVGRKVAAMRAHRTQIAPDGDFFRDGQDEWATEHFVLAAGTAGPVGADGVREDDLFAGLR
jgi:N-acetyl-1-D-myo-inositol-2-amino-2-deoxy-alpha-D-glucopyranoside deacetylase